MDFKRENRKVTYSKRVIREALYELMQQKPLGKISVKEICEMADVNRSTFYTYYEDIYDLHTSIFKDFFRLQHRIIAHTAEVIKNRSGRDGLNRAEFYDIALFYCGTVKSNRELYKFVFDGSATNEANISFGKLLYHKAKDTLSEGDGEKILASMRRGLAFANGGTIAMLIEWLAKDTKMPPEELAGRLADFYSGIF